MNIENVKSFWNSNPLFQGESRFESFHTWNFPRAAAIRQIKSHPWIVSSPGVQIALQ